MTNYRTDTAVSHRLVRKMLIVSYFRAGEDFKQACASAQVNYSKVLRWLQEDATFANALRTITKQRTTYRLGNWDAAPMGTPPGGLELYMYRKFCPRPRWCDTESIELALPCRECGNDGSLDMTKCLHCGMFYQKTLFAQLATCPDCHHRRCWGEVCSKAIEGHKKYVKEESALYAGTYKYPCNFIRRRKYNLLVQMDMSSF